MFHFTFKENNFYQSARMNKIFALLLILFAVHFKMSAQDLDARSPKDKVFANSSKQQKKADKKRDDKIKKQLKSEEKGRKAIYKMQDKSARKRMKEAKRKAKKFNRNLH